MSSTTATVEQSVKQRYSSAANEREAALCCPVSYDAEYLEVIPREIIERDYGCGDPSKHLRPGETVLDLGSGGGKICYIASQVVGAEGKVIGVDMNDEMLALARRYRREVGDRIGYHNVTFREDLFVEAFEEAGFYGIRILKRDEMPWQTIEGIEFRSVTVEAFKGKEGPCLERCQAVVYKGPWRSVTDDDGHTLRRGERMAVCDKTFHIYMSEPYKEDVEPIEPYENIPLSEAAAFDCRRDAVRSPRETKGLEYKATDTTDAPYCGPDTNCC